MSTHYKYNKRDLISEVCLLDLAVRTIITSAAMVLSTGNWDVSMR